MCKEYRFEEPAKCPRCDSEGRDGFCRFTYWSPKHQEYIDIETGEVVHPDFWLPLFPPNHERYNKKYIVSERTLSPKELAAMCGRNSEKDLERQ